MIKGRPKKRAFVAHGRSVLTRFGRTAHAGAEITLKMLGGGDITPKSHFAKLFKSGAIEYRKTLKDALAEDKSEQLSFDEAFDDEAFDDEAFDEEVPDEEVPDEEVPDEEVPDEEVPGDNIEKEIKKKSSKKRKGAKRKK
jgi:hypothetical protein